MSSFSNIPPYAYLGGFLGVVIVLLNGVVTPKLSSFYMMLLIFIAQLFTGLVIDYFKSKSNSCELDMYSKTKNI